MANVLASISDELAGTVEAAGKSIVRVEGRRRLPASGIAWSADGVAIGSEGLVGTTFPTELSGSSKTRRS